MRILVIADSVIPIPPRGYGGTERIVGYLIEELHRRGHEVSLMAGAGSRSPGRLIVFDEARGQGKVKRGTAKAGFWRRLVTELRTHDVVHSVARLDYIVPALRSKIPKVLHFENPMHVSEVSYVRKHQRGRVVLSPVGLSIMEPVRDEGVWRPVHNCADVRRYEFSAQPVQPGYVAFLGRLTRNKGLDSAIRATRAAGFRLKVGGNVPDLVEEQRFFDHEIRPLLGEDVELLGELDDIGKSELMGGAVALAMPIRWDDPCPLVPLESLACGTPVVAFARGELPYLVRDGVTGFLCSDEDEAALAESLRQASGLERATCRKEAEERFDVPVLVDKFEEVYAWLTSSQSRPPPRHWELP